MRVHSAWIAKGALALVSLALTFCLGEFVIARVAPQNLSIWDNTRDGMTIHRAHVDVYLPRYGQRIQTNGLGMRDREHDLEKTPGTTRVLVLGDSFMEALQVGFEESFPFLLERHLKDASGNVEVINLSVSGWGTDDELTYLERAGFRLEPDVVLIMMTLHNDLNDNSQLEFHRLGESGLVARPIDWMPWPRYLTQKLKAFLAGSSQIYQLAYQTSMRASVGRGAKQLDNHVAGLLRRQTSPELEDSWALTLALLDETRRLCEERGAKLVIGLIPLRVQVEDSGYLEFMTAHGLREEDMDRDGPQRRVVQWADEHGVHAFDLLDAFRNASTSVEVPLYLPEDGHWSRSGHALAAAVIGGEWANAVRGDR